MSEYDKAYYRLFNAISEAIEAMDQGFYAAAKDMLISAQQDAEDAYLASCE